MTKDILRKHSHVSSFGAIQRDCEDTVRRLQEKLQEEVNSPVRYQRSQLKASHGFARSRTRTALYEAVVCASKL